MRRLIVILYFLLASLFIQGQLIETTKVTNNTTAFGETIEVDDQVYDKYACKLYVCIS